MLVIFYILAALLIFLSFKSFRGGIDYLTFFKSEISKPEPDFRPFVTVIAPCRGVERGLRENLRALIEQRFLPYEILFVVDDENDPAVAVIKDISGKAGKAANKTRLIVACKADGSSQKVQNLREAVLHADERSEVFAFLDSDARPSRDWLQFLIAPLRDGGIGAATGYRWYISNRPTFASELRSVWNASVASALGPNTKSNFCWGGSMAVRRDVFERLDIRGKWRGTLSDDFTVTRAMRAAGMPIVFVPQALTASLGDCGMSEMLEFTTRQMKITRVYAPQMWFISLIGSALFITVMIWSIGILVWGSQNDFAVPAAATLALVTSFSAGKAWLRLKAARLVLANHESDLKRQVWTQNTLWLLTPLVFLYNAIVALFSRRLRWRGITYELKSPTETVIIAD